MSIEWTNDLKTGDPVIDSEHKRLLKAANDLVEACNKGKGREEIARATDFLSSYTNTHFAHEEELMKKHAYPEYDTHRKWHIAYIKEIETVAVKIKEQGPTVAVLAEVNTKLGVLLNHIRTMDLKLAKHIQASAK